MLVKYSGGDALRMLPALDCPLYEKESRKSSDSVSSKNVKSASPPDEAGLSRYVLLGSASQEGSWIRWPEADARAGVHLYESQI